MISLDLFLLYLHLNDNRKLTYKDDEVNWRHFVP